MNIYDLLTDYLEELDIKYLISDVFESTNLEDGYVIVFLDSDDFSANRLIDLGFKKIEYNLYLMSTAAFGEIPKDDIEKIKLDFSERYLIRKNAQEFRRRIIKNRNIWDKIVKNYFQIDNYFFDKFKVELFKPYGKVIKSAFQIPLLLVKDSNSLNEFCLHLYYLGHESISEGARKEICNVMRSELKNKNKKDHDLFKLFKNKYLKQDDFYNDIVFLRNYYIHLKVNVGNGDRKEIQSAYRDIFLKKKISDLKNDFEYFWFQQQILHDYNNYLKLLFDIFSKEEQFANYYVS